jgi:hypothetical protein
MSKTVAGVTDDEILMACAVAHGIDGFDSEEDDSYAYIADVLGLDEGLDEASQDTIDTLRARIEILMSSLRMDGLGCYGARPALTEWPRLLAGKPDNEIVGLLRGTVGP